MPLAPINNDALDDETRGIVQQAARGDSDAWQSLMDTYREPLRRAIAPRLGSRLQGRVDPSDVVQEAFVVAVRRLNDYAANPTMPFEVWLHWIANQRLLDQQRRHLAAQARGVDREVALAEPADRSAAGELQLLCRVSTPSQLAVRAEQAVRLRAALAALDTLDREILTLRHFEQLSNAEVASRLEIDKSAASKRYARALLRLKNVFVASSPGDA